MSTPARPLVHDLLAEAAGHSSDRLALVCGSRRLTFVELEARSTALAVSLARRGVGPGDRVVLFADNTPEIVLALFAVWKAGAVAAILNPLAKSDTLGAVLADCGARALVTDAHIGHVVGPALAATPALGALVVSKVLDWVTEPLDGIAGFVPFEAAIAESLASAAPARHRDASDDALLVYTASPDGRRRGVRLSHRALRGLAEVTRSLCDLQDHDVVYSAVPLARDYGMAQLLASVAAGAALVLERSFTYRGEVLARMANEGVTVFAGQPAMFALLSQGASAAPRALDTVRCVESEAPPLDEALAGTCRGLFPRARVATLHGVPECPAYGLVEPAPVEDGADCVVVARAGFELWIEDPQGRPVEPSVPGRVMVRGPTAGSGYWNGASTVGAAISTGELGRIDAGGRLTVLGRSDDLIASRGEMISPREVQAALLSIPGIVEATVVGVPDPIVGQAAKAVVRCGAGVRLDARAVIRECQARLENHLVPRQVEVSAS